MNLPANLPRNVFLFEVLLYTSLMLDCLSAAVHDRTPTAELTEKMIMASNLFSAVFILVLFFFIHHAARDRKNWPRLVLAVLLVLSVIVLVQMIAEKGIEFDSVIEIVSCALTTQGLYLSFTGDARGWFNA
jgi:protein-S-isoprenylcysteine O-methyltransferase Ste14